MFDLFFGSTFAAITTALVVGMTIFIAWVFSRHHKIQTWGRYILVFILVGTAISATSAVRDAYMTDAALFTPEGLQSTICSIAGGLIFLTGFASIVVRKQKFRKIGFTIITVLFAIQVAIIEISRILMI